MRYLMIPAMLITTCFVFAACDGETPSLEDAQKAYDKASETAGTVAEKAGEVSDFVKNLDGDKVKELAKLAAEIEKDPSKAGELLKEHGLDKKQFDEAVQKISENPELKKVFDSAKELAKQVQ